MQNENLHGMTLKDVIIGQHKQIAEINTKIQELEKKMAVIEQKATSCDVSTHSTEETLKSHAKTIDSLKGMGTLLATTLGMIISLAIFAGGSMIKLSIVDHERDSPHYRDYFKYPGHLPPAPK